MASRAKLAALAMDPASASHDYTRHRIGGSDEASAYGAALLESLGFAVAADTRRAAYDPLRDWAASGAMALSGEPGQASLGPWHLATAMRGALAALANVSTNPLAYDLDGPALLGERAAIFGYQRRGRISPGGSCHLLPSLGGWLAVNLPRSDDVELLPAWLEDSARRDTWNWIQTSLARRSGAELLERARLLGLAVAEVRSPSATPQPWYRSALHGRPSSHSSRPGPLIIDLSSLWAGPLATHLMQLCGARVIKVESRRRPDGARSGPEAFYNLLNYGKQSVALDFGCPSDRLALIRLLRNADIVVESSRPRALLQLGIDARALVETVPGLTWLSITGYGRRQPQRNWVAFGDDAAAAAGLAVAAGSEEAPAFCGDAIADPLTGVHAALAALASWHQGGARLVDISLHDVAAHALQAGKTQPRRANTRVRPEDVAAPRARQPLGSARRLGADTKAVLAEFSSRC